MQNNKKNLRRIAVLALVLPLAGCLSNGTNSGTNSLSDSGTSPSTGNLTGSSTLPATGNFPPSGSLPSTPPSTAPAAPSAKFIQTFAVYYGGGPKLTSADAPQLAKFDLLDVDRFRYDQINGNTWQAIMSINPNSQIYGECD